MSNNANNIASDALVQVNKGILDAAVGKAASIVRAIKAVVTKIATLTKELAEEQKRFIELSRDTYEVADIVGGELPNTGSNATVITATLAELNKTQKDKVVAQTRDVATNVLSIQTSIADANKELADLREDLSKVNADTVDADDIAS